MRYKLFSANCKQPTVSFAFMAIIIMLVFAACKKEDSHPFNDSPTDRMTALLNQYQSTLVGAQYGWRATVFPDSGRGGGFTFYFKFTNDNRVTMLSDISSATLTQPFESSYRMQGLQQPALIFDTYSYLHILSDPSSAVNGGTQGKGLLSDFEFAVDSASANSVSLTGRFNGSKAYMVPATQAEAQNFSSYFGTALDFEKISNLTTYFKRLVINGIEYEISVNQTTRTITLSWVANNVVNTFTTSYYYGANAVIFATPFVANGATITGFTNVHYDAGNNVINVTAGSSNGQIKTATKPLNLNVNAARNWYQAAVSQGTYWYSFTGFTVEGQVDAYGATTIPNFRYFIYWPEYSGNFDLSGFVVVENNSLALLMGTGFGTPPTFTSDGRVIFTYLGDVTNIPQAYKNIYVNTTLKMMDSNGFYLVQTGERTYDMVSAKDAKSWISWQY